jgi:hypothetical protein
MDTKTMIGKRLYPDDKDKVFELMKPGDYFKLSTTPPEFIVCCPSGHVASIRNHTIVEHEDGTITASPSILINWGDAQWHGYLEKGVWREV